VLIKELVPIENVIFDFHSTLVDGGEPGDWIEAARPGVPEPLRSRLSTYLDHLWEHAHTIDPDSERDLSPELHRDVFTRTMALCPGTDDDLIAALYDTMTAQWRAFDDTAPVLRDLKSRGVRIAVLSNIGIDIRACLAQNGLDALVDQVTLSYEVGLVKPDPAIFAHVLKALGATGETTLMVGDSARVDVGGAALGIRTLILPRTRGPVHGLEAAARLVRNFVETIPV
jgi:HAD superfamily hydrolase (TIGR01509 family)